jgi:hypothetical protein
LSELVVTREQEKERKEGGREGENHAMPPTIVRIGIPAENM